MIYRGIRDWFFRKAPFLEKIVRLAFPEKPKKPAEGKKVKAGPKSLEKQAPAIPARGEAGSRTKMNPEKEGKREA